jgi:leucyl/phenylalanyl-tRNA--protein transferase
MFSRPDLGGRDASKVCLARAIGHLRRRGFGLIDTQMWSEHLAQFGCEEVGREEYRELLLGLRDRGCEWGSLESFGEEG